MLKFPEISLLRTLNDLRVGIVVIFRDQACSSYDDKKNYQNTEKETIFVETLHPAF